MKKRKPQLELAMVPHYGEHQQSWVNAFRSLPCVLWDSLLPTSMPFSSKKGSWHIVFEISYVLIVIVVTMS